LTKAAHDGHRVALALLALAGLNAAAAAIFAFLEHRVDVGPGGRSLFAAVILLTVVGLLGAAFVRYGDPVELAHRGYRAFKVPPPHASSLSHRLLSFWGNGRADLWRLAWGDARTHPMVGTGPGTYERYFLAHQPANIGQVRDAHSLYVETLAEAGAIGLVL